MTESHSSMIQGVSFSFLKFIFSIWKKRDLVMDLMLVKKLKPQLKASGSEEEAVFES
jgi:hypothetical protein